MLPTPIAALVADVASVRPSLLPWPVLEILTQTAAPLSLVDSPDCEAARATFPVQPVNAASSLSYVAAGGWVLRAWYRRPPTGSSPTGSSRDGWSWDAMNGPVVAAALVLTGLGSAVYHSWGSGPTRWLHDAGFLLALLVLALWDAAPRWDWVTRRWVVVPLTALAVGASVVPGFANVALVALMAGVMWTQVDTWPHRSRHQRRRLTRVAAIFAAALGVYGASRTGGPLCRPTSRWQGHGVWHALTAVGLAEWAGALIGEPSSPDGFVGSPVRATSTTE